MTGQLVYLAIIAALSYGAVAYVRPRLPAIRKRAWLARVRGADTIWLHSHERGGGV